MIYGVLRTADAVTPFLTAREATISLAIFCSVYAFIFLFGTFYIYRLHPHWSCRESLFEVPHLRGSEPADVTRRRRANPRFQPDRRRRVAMVMFWVSLLAISILLYVLLDGVDLGVGLLFGLIERRSQA